MEDTNIPRSTRRVPRDFDLNLPPVEQEVVELEPHIGLRQPYPIEQEMVETNLGLLQLQSDRATAVGPIRKRPLRRCKVGGSTSAPPCYRKCPTVFSDLGNGPMEHFFPGFGLSYSPSGITYSGVRAGMFPLIRVHPHIHESRLVTPTNIEGMPTFVEYATARNPWLRNTVNFRETIMERCRNYAARQHPYNPTPNVWNNNVPSDVKSEESRFNASPAELEEVGSRPRNSRASAARLRGGHRRVQPQLQIERCAVSQPVAPQLQLIEPGSLQPLPMPQPIANQQQQQIGTSSAPTNSTHQTPPLPLQQQQQRRQQIVQENTRCMYCLKQMCMPFFNRGNCGHNFCLQCLLEEKGPLEYACFHCRWTAMHSN